ncbi:MAG: hypothetical protein M3Z36_14795 [Acidobacteriota bacterium]|nr:hypothetical protein [Acidobacteriota bacterium]
MLLVVGGHSRNIGKTSVVAGIIGLLPELQWTAMKITQYGHGVCATEGESCACAVEYDHPYALEEERDRASGTDTSRFLAAGAVRSYWLRTAQGQLGNALPAFRRICGDAQNLIVESNSILQFVKPDLYLVVVDFSVEDFKASSLRYLDRADGLVVVNVGAVEPRWEGVANGLWADKPKFFVDPPSYVNPALRGLVLLAV